MNCNTQNAKIASINEKTLIVGIDVGSEAHYARAFDWRNFEYSKKPLEFSNTEAGFQTFKAWVEELKNRMQYGELYHRNFYREVTEKNRVHYEYYNLPMTEDAPEDYTEISFVCLREDGCLELPDTVETACQTAARKVPELEGFHFHTRRHTYTTNLLSNGAQPKDVQELLGHSDVSTTMNVYAHASREAKRDSAKLLDKVVGMNKKN